MDATYSKSVRTCARAEVPRFVVLTPPFKSYNQLVRLTDKANVCKWALPLGTLCAGLVMPLFAYINFHKL